jgi:hypothetical protein
MEDKSMHANLWQWALGLTVVVVYGFQRFDSPQHMRATTTFYGYVFAKIFYVGSVVFLFFLVAGALTDPSGVYLLLSGGTLPDGVDKNVEKLPGPLLSALFLTTLLPSLPVLKTVDEWLKFQFQRFGNIPFEVRQLSRRLDEAAFRIPESLQAKVEEEMGAWSETDLTATLRPNDIRTRMPRIAALVLTAKKWGDSPRFGRFVEANKSAELEIVYRYEQIRSSLVDLWLAARKAGEPAKSVMQAVERQLRGDTLKLEKLLNDFVSSGILQGTISKASRSALIREIGFVEVQEEGRIPLRMDQIAGFAIAIFLAMSAISLMFAKWVNDSDFDRTFLIVVMVSLIYIVAIVVAVYPKSIWAEANVSADGARPYFAYLASAFLSAGLAFAIALTFKYIFIFDFNFVASLEESMNKWPWLIMSGGAAFIVAWSADDYVQNPADAPAHIRVYEAIGVAVALVLLQWFVQSLLESVATDATLAREAAHTPRRLFTAAGVGLFIGYAVPHACRTLLARGRGGRLASSINDRAQTA